MSKSNTAPKARKTPRPIKLTSHEKTLLVLYRCLSAEGQRAVDRALSAAWTARPEGSERQEEIAVGNARFGRALKALQAEHIDIDVQEHEAGPGGCELHLHRDLRLLERVGGPTLGYSVRIHAVSLRVSTAHDGCSDVGCRGCHRQPSASLESLTTYAYCIHLDRKLASAARAVNTRIEEDAHADTIPPETQPKRDAQQGARAARRARPRR